MKKGLPLDKIKPLSALLDELKFYKEVELDTQNFITVKRRASFNQWERRYNISNKETRSYTVMNLGGNSVADPHWLSGDTLGDHAGTPCAKRVICEPALHSWRRRSRAATSAGRHGKTAGRYGEFDDLWLNEQSISGNFKQTALLRIRSAGYRLSLFSINWLSISSHAFRWACENGCIWQG
jgi:hypothetical protein